MVRNSRVLVVMLAIAMSALVAACGNPLEGGSEPSGSVIRVTDAVVDGGTQDLFFCEGSAVSYVQATINLRNDSVPNFEDSPTTPDGTNSFVTMNRYRIDYAVLNMSATLPGIDGSGFSFGMDPGGVGTLTVEVVPEPVLEYVRSNFPQVGNGQSMMVRADITIWGKDAFDVDVSATATVTLNIDDINPCGSDLPPPDESSGD